MLAFGQSGWGKGRRANRKRTNGRRRRNILSFSQMGETHDRDVINESRAYSSCFESLRSVL